jgi:hypothetical protein
MEVPAKRARLTPRELKLLDLDDDALIMIIDKLDHKAKKQMMATCKRFEGLIGSTHQFYKNFKLRYNHERGDETRYMLKIRRRFVNMEISGGTEREIEQNLGPSVLEFLSKVGADVLKIKQMSESWRSARPNSEVPIKAKNL